MIEKLIELLAKGWDWIAPCVVIEAFQGAVILRWGVYGRTLDPGLHWKWPVAEVAWVTETCVTTMRLPPQTLTTRDDFSVVVAAIIKYQIKDVKPYTIDIWDQKDVLADQTMGAIRASVQEITWAELKTMPPEARVLELVRDEVNRYGFKIYRVTFTDVGRVRSFRLMQQAPKDLDN